MARRSRQPSRSRRRRRSPYDLLRRRRRLRGWAVVLAVTLALLLLLADRQGWLGPTGGDLARYDDQVFRVTRVIDGDTLEVAAPDGDEPVTTVRLWGIDTPEKARPWQGVEEEPFAEEATELARDLVQGERVRLDLEPHRLRGRYGRLLAYVQRVEDQAVLNERLLEVGLAEAEDRWPHRHLDRYELLELDAKRAGRGMWGE